MAAITICSDFGAQKNKVSYCFPSICHEVMGLDAMILVFWMLSFKPPFSLSSFTFIKRLFTFCHKGGVLCISVVIDVSPGEEFAHNAGDLSLTPGNNPWRREWQPTPVFLPGESRGQRSLVGYSPWDHKEWDTFIMLQKVEVWGSAFIAWKFPSVIPWAIFTDAWFSTQKDPLDQGTWGGKYVYLLQSPWITLWLK